jgi:hypothetical protein
MGHCKRIKAGSGVLRLGQRRWKLSGSICQELTTKDHRSPQDTLFKQDSPSTYHRAQQMPAAFRYLLCLKSKKRLTMVSRITRQKGCGFIIAAGFLLPQCLMPSNVQQIHALHF